jgi:hypothetical protein
MPAFLGHPRVEKRSLESTEWCAALRVCNLFSWSGVHRSELALLSDALERAGVVKAPRGVEQCDWLPFPDGPLGHHQPPLIKSRSLNGKFTMQHLVYPV